MVVVRAQGIARTGERYQLTCTVTSNDGSTPMITWMNVDGQIASNTSGLSLLPAVTSGTTSSSLLLLDPLSVSHEGNYTCRAIVRGTTFSYTYFVGVVASKLDDYNCKDCKAFSISYLLSLQGN